MSITLPSSSEGGIDEQKEEQEVPSLFIRAVDPEKDLESCLQIYYTTADATLRADPDALEIGSYLWMRPYLALHPSTCFILAKSSSGGQEPEGSEAVGYLLIAPSTNQHHQRIANEYLATLSQPFNGLADTTWKPTELVASLLKLLHSPLEELADIEAKYANLLGRCPAHLHIDILPEYQGQGWGRRLIEMVLEYLVEQDIGGVHLMMAEGNARARKFYEERCSFKRWREEGEGEWIMWRELQ